MSTPRTVVITGASAGIGRATARLFAARGDNVASAGPRSSRGLKVAVKRRPQRRRAGAGHSPPTSPTTARSKSAAGQVRGPFGPIDVWVNVAFTSVFAPFHRDQRPRNIAASPKSDYLASCTAPWPRWRRMRPRDAAPSCRSDPRWAPAPSRCSRAYCGAKHAINGFTESVRRTAARAQQRPHHRGPDARGQHAAVLLGAVAAAPPSPACPADLSARGRSACCAVRRRTSPPQAVLGGGEHRRHGPGAELVRPLLDRYLAKTGYASQQTSQRVSPERPTTCGNRATTRTRRPWRTRSLRQQIPHPQPAAVGVAARKSQRRRRARHGRPGRLARVATGTMSVDARIDEVAAQVYEIPTDAPEADGTLSWSSTTLWCSPRLRRAVGAGSATPTPTARAAS